MANTADRFKNFGCHTKVGEWLLPSDPIQSPLFDNVMQQVLAKCPKYLCYGNNYADLGGSRMPPGALAEFQKDCDPIKFGSSAPLPPVQTTRQTSIKTKLNPTTLLIIGGGTIAVVLLLLIVVSSR